jgi:hypothetical protein
MLLDPVVGQHFLVYLISAVRFVLFGEANDWMKRAGKSYAVNEITFVDYSNVRFVVRGTNYDDQVKRS